MSNHEQTDEKNPPEVHPAITLLLARMESHPEEFYKYDSRNPKMFGNNPNTKGATLLANAENTKSVWNREEKRLFNLALRKVRMEELHKRLMAHLLT